MPSYFVQYGVDVNLLVIKPCGLTRVGYGPPSLAFQSLTSSLRARLSLSYPIEIHIMSLPLVKSSKMLSRGCTTYDLITARPVISEQIL